MCERFKHLILIRLWTVVYISDIYDDRSSYHDTDSEVGLQKKRQKEILGNNLINHTKK